MKTRTDTPKLLPRALAALALACLCAATTFAQATSGGTTIQNRAAATYSDGTNTYSVNSNTVTVTVANVAGIIPSGPVTVTQAVIDVTGNGLGAGDVDILGNASPVLYPSASPFLARNASFTVVVRVTVNAAANAGDAISVQLGDASGDNVNSNASAAEVRTSVPASVTLTGSESEAVGSISTSVENDAKLRLELTVPAGPVALGSNITYSTTLRNNGARPVATQTLQNAPAGSNTGVFVVVPVPAGTPPQSVPAPGAGV